MRSFINSLLTKFLSIGRPLAPIAGALRSAWEAGFLRLWRPVTSSIVFLFWVAVRWCAGLNLRLFLQGLPALVIGIPSATVLAIAAFTPAQDIERRYWDRAQAATKAKNHAEAMACYERLAYLQTDRPDVLYELALSAEAAEQPERCKALMHRVAPPERLGYPKGHLWQAIRIMSDGQQSRGMRQIAETHLLKALEGGVEDKEAAHGLLGELYFTRGHFELAEPHFVVAVKTKPHFRLRLAQTYAALGNKDRARAEAKLAVNQYSTVAKADLFAHLARVKWAESVVFLEDFPQAVAILEEGLTGTGEHLYRRSLAWVYSNWFEHLGRQGNATIGQRLALLEIGLRHDPKNLVLLNHLSAVTSMRHDFRASPALTASTWGLAATSPPLGPLGLWNAAAQADADTARAALNRMLAQSPGSAQIHFALGIDAWERGKVKEASFHWERANDLSPDTPGIANNLAWLYLQTSSRDLPKALELINRAIDKAPRETAFRDTRGHILLKMNRYKEALPDLEAALPSSPNRAGLHLTLADVYTRLELPTMAEENRRLAEELTKKATRPK
jgi:tetratricopeptide (TPR) repeat protein